MESWTALPYFFCIVHNTNSKLLTLKSIAYVPRFAFYKKPAGVIVLIICSPNPKTLGSFMSLNKKLWFKYQGTISITLCGIGRWACFRPDTTIGLPIIHIVWALALCGHWGLRVYFLLEADSEAKFFFLAFFSFSLSFWLGRFSRSLEADWTLRWPSAR